MSKLTITNEDNMLLMARYPDNYFDLAIVDPPYMDGDNKALNTLGTNRLKFNIETFKDAPKKLYFDELFRVSKNQVIWGGNYFTDFLYQSRCWLMWDKIQDLKQFSDFELAWTSFDKVAKKFKRVSKGGFLTNGTIDHKIHPTQKPVDLYKWILENYSKEGDKILDTHLGSGAIAIAAHDYKYELIACELDKEYFDKAIERIKNHTNQQKLF
jgi:site-specific DNA-methyltransferase (adenine-specific)